MKTVLVLFDSLNRNMLSCYGGATVPTPNFDRLAARSVTFDQHYVGSMPCIPARRDIMTGRLSFLHRSWGPLEPFDNSFPEILARERGIYSHLITDHFHYFEDGGATYHNRYDSYEFIRGQEGDRWKALVKPEWEELRGKYAPQQYSETRRTYHRQNMINREFIKNEEEFPSQSVFAAGLDFIDRNKDADNWLLQIETFDPHEPFMAPERFKSQFDSGWNGPIRDWPPYARVTEGAAEADELRANYCATVAHCDALLGQLLDKFDSENLWDDTFLIVSTDHGYLLGEHDFWAKNRMTIYEEIAHIPLFVHDPRRPQCDGSRCSVLTQNIDMAATFLDIYGVDKPDEMEAFSLLPVLGGASSEREAALFGYFGGAVNVTDGRYTYHRYPEDLEHQEIYQYTLMPTHIFAPFSPEELKTATLTAPFSFTKGCPMLKIPVTDKSPMQNTYGPGALLENETRLYDLQNDPQQADPLEDQAIESRMISLMTGLMQANDAPPESYIRLALAGSGPAE